VDKRTKIFAVILGCSIVLLIFLVLFYLGVLRPRSFGSPQQCSFYPAGFTCVVFKLYTNGSLYLTLGQGLGKKINITGFNCTKDIDVITKNKTVLFDSMGKSILFPSGMAVAIADPSDSNRYVTCTDETGKTLTGELDSLYEGKFYINYTELETNNTKLIVGSIRAKYEV